MLVIGIDGATWDIIRPNLNELPTFKKLVENYNHKTIHLKNKPWSPSVWCSMFSGLLPDEHQHYNFVKNDEIIRREDIEVEFIWDKLYQKGLSVKAINVPFIVPPYNYNVSFTPPGEGVPISEQELVDEINSVTEKTRKILNEDKPEVTIACYTALDKLSHHHWGEPIMLEYYKKIDESLSKLINLDKKVIIISDHGFCDYDKAPVQTLPRKTKSGKLIKGDHHPDAILITKNIDVEINQPEDVFRFLAEKYGVE
jgi:predicted AlkP superfamily phosphohydrolase/phosphomutase